jgi:transcriptional regulator with XRE-family HTH domain
VTAARQAPPSITLGDRLRRARLDAGLDKVRLAELTGISRNSVANYESGRSRPRLPQVIAWSQATGAPLDWLLDVKSSRGRVTSAA